MMTAATRALAEWREVMQSIVGHPWPISAPADNDQLQYSVFLLQDILPGIAFDAERFGIDPTPIWQTHAGIEHLWQSVDFWSAIDMMLLAAELIETKEAGVQGDGPEFLTAASMRHWFKRGGRSISKSYFQSILMDHVGPDDKRQATSDGRNTWEFKVSAVIKHMQGTTWQCVKK